MKKTAIVICLVAICIWANGQSDTRKIPVTTSSEKALGFYNEAMKALQDVELIKFGTLLSQALREDPDFFMANYQLAMIAVYQNQEKDFIRFATAATTSKSKLSEGEKILQDAVKTLIENRSADLTAYGKKLVQMYPEDVDSYLNLSMFQYSKKDIEGQISTLNDALKISERKDYIYNSLAYAYMEKDQFKEAEMALDKYVALSPQLPNPYDSKGDLYMKTKEYDKAYEYFMKANSIDTAWSKSKILKAKALAGGSKASDIIGTYEYSGDQKGIAIINEKYFIWTLESKSTVTDSEIRQQDPFNSKTAGGGTWTMQDSIVTCTYRYHINPEMIGTSLRFVTTKNGNLYKYRIIDKEGKVIGTSSAVKID